MRTERHEMTLSKVNLLTGAPPSHCGITGILARCSCDSWESRQLYREAVEMEHERHLSAVYSVRLRRVA